ncbi:MAG TPA: ATP-binding protein [Nitrososphaeraceae archaeon]|nr:ATP-binding protein [Nitrososphaeraceae archaeon]
MLDKRSSNNNNCALCGRLLFSKKEKKSKAVEEESEEIINGIHFRFDTKDCAVLFKRFRSVYGDSKFKELLGQEQYISDPFWNKVIPTEQEIREIEKEESEKSENIILQIIRDPAEVQKLGFELIRSAKEEILIIFSTANAFHRQIRVGGAKLLREVTIAKRDLNIRILTPQDERIKEVSSELKQQLKKIEVRHVEESLQTKVTVLIVDRKYSLSIEFKDDTKDSVYEAIGLATYSNSKSTVISYISIFESLWKQVELIERVTKLSEELKYQENVHRQFINVAAHELRSPIQPILGLAEILRSRKERETDEKQDELLAIIIRNAKRLKELTENILDITRIENQSLNLHKEVVNIDELISKALEDIKSQTNYKKSIRLIYDDSKKEFSSPLLVEADRGRLIQVISNLLSNAIKFTKEEGTITVTIEKRSNNNMDLLLVRVKDTGTGIDDDIMPRLFEKFVTRSEKGIGLGLFISKSIIEAHGGRIWAENNADGKGATFTFTLPLLSAK